MIIVVTTVVVTALAIAASSSQEERFESSAEVFLSGARNLPSNIADLTAYSIDPERTANTQAKLARTPEVARQALAKARVRDLTADELLANTTVVNPTHTDILRFSVTDSDRERAEHLATNYAGAFTEYRRKLDTGSIVAAREQIEKRLAALEKAGEVKTDLYRHLAENDQQLRTNEALQGSNVSLVRPGTAAVQTQPQTRRNAVLGAVLGLLIGVGLAYLRDALNTRVRSSQEVQETLELPLLARIPELPPPLVSGGVAMVQNPHAPETEAFRILATNLGFVNMDRGAKSIMVSSANRAEGKSTTVSNAAVALARTGRHVTLIDLDLKQPAVARLFGIAPDRPGVTNVAAGMAKLEDALTEIPISAAGGASSNGGGGTRGSLHVLTTGPLPPDSADFVASPRLTEILVELMDRSDIVLVDAPPLLQVSDAMALTAKVDALMLVTRMSVIRRPALSELHRVADAAPVAKLGFVLTGAAAEDGYAYGYGYGYGYAGPTDSQGGKGEEAPQPVVTGSRASGPPSRRR